MTGQHPDDGEAYIWIDPGRQTGMPCFNGTRIPVYMAAEWLWDLGNEEGIRELLGGYDLTERQILVACWFMVEHSHERRWKKRWGDWAEDAFPLLWRSDGPLPPLPPENPARSAAGGGPA